MMEENTRQGNMVGIPLSADKILQNLDILSKEVNAIRLTDIDGSTFTAHIVEMSEIQVKGQTREGTEAFSRAIRLTLLQSNTQTAQPWGSVYWGQFHWG